MKNKHIEAYLSDVNEFNELIDNFDRLAAELKEAYKHFNGRTLYPDFKDKHYFKLLQDASRDVMRINTIKKTICKK